MYRLRLGIVSPFLPQGLDLIVNGLEETAAKVRTGDRDLPAQGVRRLATKLRQKMDKTPPLWQVRN